MPESVNKERVCDDALATVHNIQAAWLLSPTADCSCLIFLNASEGDFFFFQGSARKASVSNTCHKLVR